jgi:hypothetical protein
LFCGFLGGNGIELVARWDYSAPRNGIEGNSHFSREDKENYWFVVGAKK